MIADAFFRKFAEAMSEAGRRRASSEHIGYITHVDRSPYGGYRVRSLPAEFLVDEMLEGPLSGSLLRDRRARMRA